MRLLVVIFFLCAHCILRPSLHKLRACWWSLTPCIVLPYISDPTLRNESHWYFSWNFEFYTLVKSIHFPFKWYQNYANLPTGSKVIDKSIWLPYRVPFWEIGLRKFVSHTTVLQQLQFKMAETVINHHIWSLKVMFSNRMMPEAHDFDENRKSTFLTCRSKIVAFCIVTEYQCDSLQAVGSHIGGNRKREALRSGVACARWGMSRWVPHQDGAPWGACWSPA